MLVANKYLYFWFHHWFGATLLGSSWQDVILVMYGASHDDHHKQKFQQIVEHWLGKWKLKLEANGNDMCSSVGISFVFVIVQWRRVDACLEYNSMIWKKYIPLTKVRSQLFHNHSYSLCIVLTFSKLCNYSHIC